MNTKHVDALRTMCGLYILFGVMLFVPFLDGERKEVVLWTFAGTDLLAVITWLWADDRYDQLSRGRQ